MNNVDIYLFSNDAPNSYKTKERLDYLVLHILRNRKTKTESLGRFMFSH